MNIDLEIFTFQNISYERGKPSLADWESLGKDKSNSHNEEVIFFSHDINELNGGFEIIIYSSINVPSHSLSGNSIEKGTYQKYDSKSTFYTNHPKVTDSMVSELTLSHFSACAKDIFVDTNNKYKNGYMVKILSLSKIFIIVENGGQRKSLRG